MSKTLLRINIQHKLFTKTGEKPTVPSPSGLKPGEDGFGDTDILEGEWAYNRADDIWYYRSNNQIKELSGANVEYATQPESEESDPAQAIDNKSMSPLRTLQAFISHAKNYVFSVLNTANKTLTGAINELENNKSNTGHTHVEGDITNLDKYGQSTVDSKLAGKKDDFTENTAFNQDYASQAESETTDTNTAATNKVLNVLRGIQLFTYNAVNYTFSSLNTTSKDIISAINELFTNKVTKDGDSPGAGTKLRVGKKDNGTFALIAGDVEIATLDHNGNFTIHGQSDSNSVTAFIVNALSQNGLFKVQSDGSISAYAFQGSGLTNLHTDAAGNLIATEPIYSFLVQDLADQNALEDTSNWDSNNSFTGSLNNTKQGQYWYDSNYYYLLLEDNIPVREDRGGYRLRAKQNYYNVTNSVEDHELLINVNSGSSETVLLPSSPSVGQWLTIKTNTGNGVTVDGNGKSMDGNSTITLANFGNYVQIMYNGTDWDMFSRDFS